MATMGQDYQQILTNRLNEIQSMGENQTTWDRLKSQKALSQQRANDQMALLDSQYNAAADQRAQQQKITDAGNAASSAVVGNDPFNKFKSSIMTQESGGNYSATNGGTGALGAYQVLPANINGTNSGWDYEALGYDVTPQQYLASPQLQEKVVGYKLQQYYQKYGPAGAAVAWYAGPGAANDYARSGMASGRPQSGGNPSVSSYVQQILARLGL